MRYVTLLCFLLCACTGEPLRKSYELETVKLTWIRVPVERMARVCNGERVLGCTVYTGPGECTIYSPEPEGDTDDYRMAILGHEALHCFIGAVH